MEEKNSISVITIIFCEIVFIPSKNFYQVNSFGYRYDQNVLLQSSLPRILFDAKEEAMISGVFLSLFFDILNQGNFLTEPKL